MNENGGRGREVGQGETSEFYWGLLGLPI